MSIPKTLLLVITLITFSVIIISFSVRQTGDSEVVFSVPKGWPKPAYNFKKNPVTQDGFKLGRRLFFDPVLSRDSSISCNSCHTQFSAFTHVDHPVSHGINGLKGTRNATTIFNMAWNTSFMWDGRVKTLEEQPVNPITNPVEMDNTMENIVNKLSQSTSYKEDFKKAFGSTTITSQQVLKALAQFLVSLQSYNTKYDKVIVQKSKDINFTEDEKEGLQIFRNHCAQCHKEPLFTDNRFKNIGMKVIPFYKDYGRMLITHDPKDSLLFRVPSLRNVAASYPYMHDGRFNTLEEVIDHYRSGVVQSPTLAPELREPLIIDNKQKAQLIAFLNTLTDDEFLYDIRFRNWAR
jgi:cytochrome c peroxidase